MKPIELYQPDDGQKQDNLNRSVGSVEIVYKGKSKNIKKMKKAKT